MALGVRVALAQATKVPSRLPPTSVTSEDDVASTTERPTANPAGTAPTAHPKGKDLPYAGPVDPAQGMLQLKEDTSAFARPDKSSTAIEQLQAGKYVKVTGTTHYFIRIRLKNGEVAFVPMSAVNLARPTDKIFRLTQDTPVLSLPTRFGTKLAEVHNGHDVHVIGVSMNYMKIRMKSGLEGYITSSALQ